MCAHSFFIVAGWSPSPASVQVAENEKDVAQLMVACEQSTKRRGVDKLIPTAAL
jgi:hypothetical protein